MKRLFSLLCMLAAVTTALWHVPVAQAAPEGCACGSTQYTPQSWAQAATCDQATANLRAAGYAQIFCDADNGYGTCSRILVLTAGCHWDTNTGKWQVDGYVQYRCWTCG